MCSSVPLVILCNCVLLFWQVSSSLATNCSTSGAPQEQPVPGDGIELVLAKLDHLQNKLETLLNLTGQNLTILQEQSRKILAHQAAFNSHEQMRKESLQLSPEQEPSTIGQLLNATSNSQGPWTPCKEAPANSSGVYSIKMGEEEGAFDAFCEQSSFGGGWLVIQYRFDGSLDFYRNWTEYRNGFGDIKGEFWFGLEKIHQLTSRQQNELMVEMKDFDGAYSYAHYKHFEIGSETEHYPLKELGAYDGNAGDALDYNRGMKFSTMDKEHSETNCAAEKEAGWWHNYCTDANLNGRYLNKEGVKKSISWNESAFNYHGLAYTRMMIREVEK
uniref:Fibrinogen C-terminal domain-containing protein n=1 Tax=Anopheles atroparvus TaxID=41427 RepID=A0AAG5DL16_ANOAO